MAFEQHRNKNGQISGKHGNTLIRTLRKHYGASFATGCQRHFESDPGLSISAL